MTPQRPAAPTFGFTLRWHPLDADADAEDEYFAVEVRETLSWYRWSHRTEVSQRTILLEQTRAEFVREGAPRWAPDSIVRVLRTRLERGE